jgi:predicted nucleic acid-binding protein
MKQAVFVDTSAWLALINESDADHAKARTVRDKLLQGKKLFFVCTSFVVMKKYAIRDAFTNDHHFEQAGFEALIK